MDHPYIGNISIMFNLELALSWLDSQLHAHDCDHNNIICCSMIKSYNRI